MITGFETLRTETFTEDDEEVTFEVCKVLNDQDAPQWALLSAGYRYIVGGQEEAVLAELNGLLDHIIAEAAA